MKSEQEIQNEIRVGLSKAGHMVFRTNVGKVKMMDGRWFDTGLPKGHPDLYGFRSDGQIFYIEVKNEKGRVRPEQKKFRELYTSLHHQQHIVFMRISKKATSKRKSSFNNV